MVYDDSTAFDDAFGRLREIDFEDLYSVTTERITFRNPWGLNCFGDTDETNPDSVDNYLLLGQGATLDFPTRTRAVEIDGGADRFRIVVTDFNDSVYTIFADSLPLFHSDPNGIKRMQFFGFNHWGDDDVNWRIGMTEVRLLDGDGNPLAYTDFEELLPDHFYILGRGMHAYASDLDPSIFEPNDVHGVSITEPFFGFLGTYLVPPYGRPDPHNPIGNLAVELTPDGTIDFPQGVEGALLVLESVHVLDTVWIEATDYAGDVDTVEQIGWGRPVDTNWVEDQWFSYLHVGLASPAGIRQVRLLGTARTGTMMLGAIHLAEMPRNEIAAIGSSVSELDSAGYLGSEEYDRLQAKLVDAMEDVERNDRSGAIGTLLQFRRDVEELYENDVLVPEEANRFLDAAAYVIERLGGFPSAVDEHAGSAGVLLGMPVLSADGIRIGYTIPAGDDATIRISDIRGTLLRTLEIEAGDDGLTIWDLRDADGNRVPAGVYFVTLNANGVSATRMAQIVR